MAQPAHPAIDIWVRYRLQDAGCGWKFQPARLLSKVAPSARCLSANTMAGRPGTPLEKRRSSLQTTPAPEAEPIRQDLEAELAQGAEPIRLGRVDPEA